MRFSVTKELQKSTPHPVLEPVPPGRGVVHGDALQRQHHLPQEVVPAEHVAVPDRQPHRAALDLGKGELELEGRKGMVLQVIFHIYELLKETLAFTK